MNADKRRFRPKARRKSSRGVKLSLSPEPKLSKKRKAEIEKAWKIEVRRRISDCDTSKIKCIPAEEVMRNAYRALKKMTRVSKKVRHMTKRNLFWFAVSFLLAAITISCTTVPFASASEDQTAKAFQPSSDKAVLYVYQRDSGGGFELLMDGKVAGNLINNTYFRFEIDPGEHTISSHWGGESERFIYKTKVEAGKIYFVEHRWNLKILAPPNAKFAEKKDSDGKVDLIKCKLVKCLF
jgi:hypothetical protein